MLHISRKRDEAIVIGGNIVVKVIAVEGNKVRLGIQAPREVLIRRDDWEGELPKETGNEDEDQGR